MNKAKNFGDLSALKEMALPGLNIIYADKDNNIFYIDNGHFAKKILLSFVGVKQQCQRDIKCDTNSAPLMSNADESTDHVSVSPITGLLHSV